MGLSGAIAEVETSVPTGGLEDNGQVGALMNQVRAVVVFLLMVSGVSAQPSAELEPPAGSAELTFAEHVAPIVFQRCATCHRPGEPAPFSLLSYRDVRKRGRTISRVVGKRLMPPWLPVEGHGEFAGNLRLSDDEIETIQRWVESGMAEGDASLTPPLPEFLDGWQLGEPDLIVEMSEGFPVPASGPDIYRNFVIPMGLDEDRWVTAIEVRPGARSVLHHIIFSVDTTGSAARQDGRDGQPGFSGMSGAGRRGNIGTSTAGLGGWAVGGMPRHLPMGLAFELPQGSDLVLQSHFHPSGKPEVERTQLGLYFTDQPPERRMVGLQLPPMFGAAAGLDVPAGDADFRLEDSFTLPVDALAVTVGGHAHMICREMQVFATPPGGERRSIFYIDDWDFDWQNRYQYLEPLSLPAGTLIETVIVYDNSADNLDNPNDPPQRIRWGLQSTDEMGSVTLLLVASEDSDHGELRRAIRQHSAEHLRLGRAAGAGSLGAGIVSRLKMLDRNGDGRIEEHEVPRRYRRSMQRIDSNGDGVIDQAELDAAVKQLGGGRR